MQSSPNLPPTPERKEIFPIDSDFVPLDKTKLYDLAARFIFRENTADDTPDVIIGSFQTNSVLAAHEVIKVAEAIFDSQPEPPQNIIFLEIGAGSATLSDNIRRLTQRYDSPLNGETIRVIATDAYVDLSNRPISRRIESRQINPLKEIPEDLPRETPIIIYGNYFLDQLPNDCVVKRDGRIQRVLIKALSTVDLSTSSTSDEFATLVRKRQIFIEKKYQDLSSEEIVLPIYADLPEDQEVLIPIGAYELLKKWADAGFHNFTFFFKDYQDEASTDRLYTPIALGFGLGVNFPRLYAACAHLGFSARLVEGFFSVLVVSNNKVPETVSDTITEHEQDINNMAETMLLLDDAQQQLEKSKIPEEEQISDWERQIAQWKHKYPFFHEVGQQLSLLKMMIDRRKKTI